MEASGAHLLSDAWSTVAMVVGLLLIRITGLMWLDQLFAIAFAVYIIYTGLRVFRRSVAGIMDETDLELAATVIAMLEEQPSPAMGGRAQFPDDQVRIRAPHRLPRDAAVVLLPGAGPPEIAAIEELVNARHDQRRGALHPHGPLHPPLLLHLPIGRVPRAQSTLQGPHHLDTGQRAGQRETRQPLVQGAPRVTIVTGIACDRPDLCPLNTDKMMENNQMPRIGDKAPDFEATTTMAH